MEMATFKLTVFAGLLTFCLVHSTDVVDDVRLAQLIKEREVRSTSSVQISKPTPTRHFEHYVQLDTEGNYWLFWSTNATHVTFETHVNTHGYIGFGISPNGKMFPADVIVGGVKDGQTYFKDYHTTQHAPPVVDQSQDWFLIAGKETASGTILTFVRKLNTCDSVGDMVITDDTTRIIFSYNPEDVTSYIPYHGATRRGTKSVLLLSSTLTADDVHIPSDTITYDFLHDNYHLPSDTTTYFCRAFKLPQMTKKHHMIKFEPIVTPGNELNVHHILIFKCDKRAAELASYDGAHFRCEKGETVPEPLRGCLSKVILAWAIGGETFYYPPTAGYSLGTDADPDFFVMETHFDNPLAKSGNIIDSSGIRITMTPTLRTHDAGLLQIGLGVSPLQLVPPMEPSFVSEGFCPSELLGKGVPKEGINVFAMVQHSHLLGKKMITRHFRNGRELEPLAADTHYDFNFQDMRYLSKEKKVYPMDKINVKCVYDSRHKREPTLGGLSTNEEMCLSFIAYYPRMHLDNCQSLPIYNTISSNFNDVRSILRSWNWTDPAVRTKFQSALDNSIHYHFSSGDTAAVNHFVIVIHHIFKIPKPTPTRHFEHYVRLDTTGQFWLFWTANTTHVIFETHVNTHGYIGFGISPNGKMFPADVIVGGVKDGQTYFKDYHTTEHSPPVVDQSQDWFLIAGKETASGTVLTFVRKLNTCDSVGDMVITDDTTRLIFSYNPVDVTSYIPYHGATRRGTKSVMLLSSSLTPEDVNFPSDISTFDLVQDNYHVPNSTTTYACRAFMLPPLTSKHHMIKYESVITKGNELNVHHIIVNRCDKRAAELAAYDGAAFQCGDGKSEPEPLRSCLYKVIIAWTVGGEAFYYPPSAGYSLGTDDDPDFLILQTHYNNPLARADIVDSSGIRITMTPTLRTHDAGLLLLGMSESPMHIIPPMEPAFVSQGFCPPELLGKGVPQEGINVFAILQHSHLLGKEMITRLYRNGSELEPLAVDRHYDFDYQDMRYLSKERKIYPVMYDENK
ncbi:DBH-like monooxygenase protein 1 [Mizuhopecten yessoensis]|uniref:DBH-like monooxygenase protein 1 n=1 Tax=Mizuhopecten yessoensis TaxID=6573 RepID=A0A210PUG8_MIZYE|nr:DBH-like monooxygenase protein 1 [Mizuhopecten yessoensis]